MLKSKVFAKSFRIDIINDLKMADTKVRRMMRREKDRALKTRRSRDRSLKNSDVSFDAFEKKAAEDAADKERERKELEEEEARKAQEEYEFYCVPNGRGWCSDCGYSGSCDICVSLDDFSAYDDYD
jgi:hypothetical protein